MPAPPATPIGLYIRASAFSSMASHGARRPTLFFPRQYSAPDSYFEVSDTSSETTPTARPTSRKSTSATTVTPGAAVPAA